MVRRFQRGAMSLQMLVLMVPVVLGLMGFGLDLGRLYLVKGELNQAAEAMAQAAAARLIGTDAAPDNATSAARRALDNANGHGNKYNFGSLVIGESTGFLASEVQDPFYYDSAAAAIGEDSAAQGGEAVGSTAKHVRVNISAEAPLLFWGVLSLGQERKTRIAAQAAAGISAPLCVACGIEPLAIAALSQDDTTDFGFTVGTKYTFGYQCTGLPNPAPLTGGSGRLPYLILNRLNEETTVEEGQQLYRIGAQGLPGSTNSALSCIAINAEEQVWASATPIQCNMNQVPNS
ncbi:MAG: hypothetical protein HY013_00065, partial [Candidatus Solibacter usitatus]|nr:hypothetical protein [Candidatus Solibacter usitatus]